jgi:hypothetical protein
MNDFNIDVLGEIRQYIQVIIPIVFSVMIQIIKKLLSARGKGFKRNDSWFILVLCLGPVMAVIDYGLINFVGFNWSRFIIMSGAYSAGSVFFYKATKTAIDRLKLLNSGQAPQEPGGSA